TSHRSQGTNTQTLGAKISHGCAKNWMHQARSEISQGLQHEQTLVQTRMRNRKTRFCANQTTVKEEVEVNGARPIRLSANPAKSMPHVEKPRQKHCGLQVRLDFCNRIQVGALPGRTTHGGRLIDR